MSKFTQEHNEQGEDAMSTDETQRRVREAIQELRSLRDGLRLKGLDWKELRDEGKRQGG